MKVAFNTLGCKVNTYETEALERLFKERSFDVVNYKEIADVYVINTCTVTNTADSKSRKAIRQAIKRNPDAIVAVIGCYSQVASEEVAAIEGVDIIMGTSERERLIERVEMFIRDRKQILDVKDMSRYKQFDALNVTSFSENTRAFIKIQDGCNQYCSFCIIPYARGPVRSRPKDEILDEAKTLIDHGYKEIVLTGIHTGGYGSDLKDTSLYDLLHAFTKLSGLKRLRISSIEINQLSDEILRLMSEHSLFARHLHIPLQSGSERVLKDMRRRYTLDEFEEKLKTIRELMPDIAITTDVIVGYPGETDKDFVEIKETLKRFMFSELHVFPYSKRSGTKAAMMKEQVHGTVKSLRVNELLKLNETLANAFIESIKEHPETVLFERCNGEYCTGHTSRYITVKVKTEADLVNAMHRIKVTSVNYPESIAKLID